MNEQISSNGDQTNCDQFKNIYESGIKSYAKAKEEEEEEKGKERRTKMKIIVILATAVCVGSVIAYPHSEEQIKSEALNRLMLIEADDKDALRSKRTIGILREVFPEISQMIEQKVNSIVAEFIRIFGPTLLQSALGNRPKTGGGSSSQSLTASPESPFKDDENNFVSTSNDGSKVSISLPTFPPDEDEGATSGTTSEPTTTDRGQDAANTVDVNPETEDRANEVQQVAESQKNEVKVQFADEEGAADAAAPLTPLDEVVNEDDENRNKRFLSSLGGLSGSGSSGSGNFLFDILRQAADGAARAAGTVYRVVAGTQSLGLGLSASRDLGPVPQGAAPAAASSSTTAGSSTSAPAASGAGSLPPKEAGARFVDFCSSVDLVRCDASSLSLTNPCVYIPVIPVFRTIERISFIENSMKIKNIKERYFQLFEPPGSDERAHRQLQGETDHFHHLGDKRAISKRKEKKKCPMTIERSLGNHHSWAVIVEQGARGSTFGFFVPVSGSTVVKIHLVHGLTVLKITSPIFTQPQVSSSYADAPLITKLGRNCSGLTGFSNRRMYGERASRELIYGEKRISPEDILISDAVSFAAA
ncbi:hypothetical protein APICC_08017 [Apis cerana cerana]|uniref:Uncharacterized protein n=1 Tax=Apis cerana cerana TaxID=94128 RepID=A0A2A3ER64_APICC|nr:hypothetical protein APICC_08017 [Apis cerana cerana]